MIRAVSTVSLLLLVSACQRSSDASAPAEPAPTPPTNVPVQVLSAADLGRVCRATIGALNGRDPGIIQVTSVENDMAYVSYVRPDDGKVWKSRCRVDGDRVLWVAMDLSGPGSGPGRWRNDPEDEMITYAITGPTVTIKLRYSDGSGDEHAYQIPTT